MVLQTSGALSLSNIRSELFQPEVVLPDIDQISWEKRMTLFTYAGSFTGLWTGAEPNRQLQMSDPGQGSNINQLYHQYRWQDLPQFTLSFEIYSESAGADGLGVFFGCTSPAYGEINAPGGFSFQFTTYWQSSKGRGIQLLQDDSVVVPNSTQTWVNASAWYSVVINYVRGTHNTWSISLNNALLYSYSDAGNAGWLGTSGPYWGFSSRTGGEAQYLWVRRIRLTPYRQPLQALVDPISWVSKMSTVQVGSFAPVYRDGDPNVQVQVSNNGQFEGNRVYDQNTRVQDYKSFVFSTQFYYVGGGDYFSFSFGGTSAGGANGVVMVFFIYSGYSNNGFSGTGLYLMKADAGGGWTAVAFAAYSALAALGSQWFPITVQYNRGTTNTWRVYVLGKLLLSYSDPNHAAWLTTTGSYWGMYAESGGGLRMLSFFRQIQLSYIPQTVKYSALRGITAGVPGTGTVKLSNFYGTQPASVSGPQVLAVDLGASALLSSADTGARVLWNAADSLTSAPAGVYVLFQQTFVNTTQTPIAATMSIVVDDCAFIHQNKSRIWYSYWAAATFNTVQVNLPPGKNLFEFVCWNTALGQALVIWTLTNNSGGAVLMHSDNQTATLLPNSTRVTMPVPYSPSVIWPNNKCPLDAVSKVKTKNYCRGAYALVRLSATYTGPTVTVRRSADNAMSDFYSNLYGALGQQVNGTGTTYTSWLGASTGYVATWYDQQGSGNHATQTTAQLQPQLTYMTYYGEVTYAVDFLNSSTLYLNIPQGTVPVGVLNSAYSFILRHGLLNNGNASPVIGAGTQVSNCDNTLFITSSVIAGAQYKDNWWAADAMYGTYVSGNRVCASYDGTTRKGYINSANVYSAAASGRTTTAGQQYIGRDLSNGNYLNGQLFYLYVFGAAVPDADRLLLNY